MARNIVYHASVAAGLAILVMATLAAGSVLAAAEPAYPALITSAGQSPDGLILKVVVNDKSGLNMPYKQLAKVEDLAGVKTLVFAVGVSAKGLGAAGINIDQEIARVKALLEEAKKNNIYVVLVHIGGTARRGASSDEVSKMVGSYAHRIIVASAGNADGFFTKMAAERNIPLVIVEDRNAVGPEFVGLMPGTGKN
ncbi:MAG: DUF6305 family protein [Firmicutes bacterium]|jgi:hypothetical protein|nr:DUF6305 family protein [Bacillota bacterium]